MARHRSGERTVANEEAKLDNAIQRRFGEVSRRYKDHFIVYQVVATRVPGPLLRARTNENAKGGFGQSCPSLS
jgi:hypothetical protein